MPSKLGADVPKAPIPPRSGPPGARLLVARGPPGIGLLPSKPGAGDGASPGAAPSIVGGVVLKVTAEVEPAGGGEVPSMEDPGATDVGPATSPTEPSADAVEGSPASAPVATCTAPPKESAKDLT